MNVAVRGVDDDVASSIGLAGGTVVSEGSDRDVDAVVAVGEEAIRSAAVDPPDAPLVPVTADGGRHLVPRASLAGTLAAFADGERRVVTHPVLRVRRDGSVVTRLCRDVVLVTDAPASISEYAVATGEETAGSVRADGVVVATPLGSDGYAAAAGGPVLDADTGVAVVHVAPFSTAAETRVADPSAGLTLSVEREGAVALFADGVRNGTLDVGDDVRIERAGTLDVVSNGTEKF